MSAHRVCLLLACLLVCLTSYRLLAQPRLLSETELDTAQRWYPRPFSFNGEYELPPTTYASFGELAKQIKAGKKVVAVEINPGISDWENLKLCSSIQFVGVATWNEGFLDTLLKSIADLPIQQIRINTFSYGRTLQETTTKKQIRIAPSISKLKFLSKVILSGMQFDWEDTFSTLATIPSFQKLYLTGFYGYNQERNTQISLPGIERIPQLTHLTVDATIAVRLASDVGQLTQLRALMISGLEQSTSEDAKKIRLDRLTKLETLVIPANLIADVADFEKLGHLKKIKLTGGQTTQIKLPDFSRLPELEEVELAALGINTWPEGLCTSKMLRRLELRGNRITAIPPCITNLIELETLSLSANPLRSLPVSIGLLTKLKNLDLSYCQLDTLPNVFSDFAQLSVLNLSSNRLKEIPASIGQLLEMTRFDARANKIQQLPASFKQLRKLDNLDLSSNQLTDITSFLGSLTNLTTFICSGNHLTQLPISIGTLRKLTLLNVGNNKLTHLPPELGQLRRLKRLYLNNNALIALPESLVLLDSLKTLDLRNNRLSQLPEQMGNWHQLTDLYIQQCPLTRLPESIGQLIKLRQLELTDMPLTALPAGLGNLKELQNLTISKTKIRLLPSELGKLSKLRSVSFMDNELMALPDEIGEWHSVVNLSLRENRLTGLPNTIGRLKKLMNLSLIGQPSGSQGIQTLPDSIIHCKALWHITIMLLPELDANDAFQKLVQLPNVQTLAIDACKLSRWPETNWKTSSLQTLKLSQNALSTVPTALLDAPKLRTVDLHDNPLPKPLDAFFSSKDQLRVALAEIGQISLESAKPNWSVASGFMQSSRRKSMQRDWSGTLDDLDKAIEYAPDSMASIVYSQRAEFQFFRKQFTESMADFDKALMYWPKLTNSISGPNNAGRGLETKNRLRATWWARKAMARGQLAQYDAALKDANQAVQLLVPLSATPNREDAQATGMVYIEQGRFQLLTNRRKEMLESFTKAMDAYEKIQYADPGLQLTTVELGIIGQQYDRAAKALDKVDEYQRRDGYATLHEYLKTCLAVLTEKQTPVQATEAMQTYVRTHGSQIMGWSFDLFDAWLTGADLPTAKADALKQLTATVKERAVKME